MFGRAAAETEIGRVLASASRSRTSVLRLVGEPGMGKTMLCRRALAKAAAWGFLTVSCAGMEWESEFAMATMGELLRPLLQVCDGMPAAAHGIVRELIDAKPLSTTDAYAVATAALATVAGAAESKPVLLVVDDAHWVDAASAAAITFAVRRLYADAVALVVSERSHHPSPFPRDWPTHVLTPLSSADIGELLAAERPDLPLASGAVRDVLQRRSGGNPLVLHELAPTLTASQLTGVEPLPDPLPLGERGVVSFGSQIAALPQRTRDALGVVAAAGSQSVLVQGALAALGLDAGDLDVAVEERIVTAAPESQFTHPLRRSAAYQAMPERTRRLVHRTLADLNTDVDVERRAFHLDLAGAAPDVIAAATESAAVSIAARAGDGAAAGAWARSADLTGEPGARRRRALRAAASFLAAGDGEACFRWLDEVLRRSPLAGTVPERSQDDEVTAEALLVQCEAAVWQTAEADLTALAADAERLALLDRRRAVLAFGLLAAAYENRGRLPESMAVTRRALESADELDDQYRFIATTWAAHVITLADGAAKAAAIGAIVSLDAARALAEASPMTLWTIAQTAGWQDDLPFADRLSRLSIEALRKRGLVSWLPYALSVDADIQWRTGACARARASAAEAVELADTAGQVGLIGFTLAIAGLIAGLTGAADESGQYLRRALRVAADTDLIPVELYARQSYGAVALARGRVRDAAAQLDRAHDIALGVGMGQPSVVPYHADHIEALARAGRHDDAFRMLQQLHDATERSGSRWAAAVELRCRAQLRPDDPDSEAWLRQSIARFTTDVPQPFERHRCELELGALLRRKRRLADARRVLADAAAGFRDLGTPDWLDRCDAERRAAGDRDPVSPRAAGGALAGLTAQQLQVVLSVAAGATNREAAAALFLSPKTVDYHLRRACAALGVRSRVELARLVATLPAPGN